MAFSQADITTINPPQHWGAQIYLSWTTSSPAGTWFQIYIDGTLAWFGQSNSVRLPLPPNGINRVDIGTVDAGEEQTDFSSGLQVAPGRRALLTWLGGTFEGSDIAGFQVYGSDTAGGSIDYGAVLAEITAYPAGIYTDGFGLGRFGVAGFGESASTYTWTTDTLTSGIWSFGVLPYDQNGNLGTAATTTISITVPPLAPPSYDDRTHLKYTFDAITEEATLLWNASPG